MKNCKHCNISKPLTDFETGRNVCRICRGLQKKQWSVNNPDKLEGYAITSNEKQRAKRKTDPEAFRAYKKDYYRRNKAKLLKYQKDWAKKKIYKQWKEAAK